MKTALCVCVLAVIGWGACAVVYFGGDVPARGAEGGRGDPSIKVAAPEIDPTTITGPLVLLGAGTLILTDRRRRAGSGV